MLCDGETRKRKVDRRRGIEKKKTMKQRKKKRKTVEVVATTLALPTVVVVVVSVVGRGGEHRPRTRRSERWPWSGGCSGGSRLCGARWWGKSIVTERSLAVRSLSGSWLCVRVRACAYVCVCMYGRGYACIGYEERDEGGTAVEKSGRKRRRNCAPAASHVANHS